MAEYKGVLAMMNGDKNDKKWGQKAQVSSIVLFYPSFVALGILLKARTILEFLTSLVLEFGFREASGNDYVLDVKLF